MVEAGYKQTEVGVIPEDWDIKTILEATTEVGDGIHATPTYSQNGEYYFINGNNIVNGSIVIFSDTKTVSESEFKKHKKPLSNRTIFLSINGTIGNVGYYRGEPIILGKSAAYLNIKPSLSKEYVFYNLQTNSTTRSFEDGLTGTTIKNLGLGTIRDTKIPIPKEEAEQKTIAKALSDVDELIVSLEKFIAKKQDIKTATMQQLLIGKKRLTGFGEGKGYKQTELGQIPEDWDVVLLGNISKIEMGQSPSSSNYNSKGIGLPLIQGNADIKDRQTIIRNYTSQITKLANYGDIILSVRAPVGEAAVAVFKCCIGRGVCAIRYTNDYLYHWLVSFEKSWEKYSKGSTFDSINSNELKELKLYLPTCKKEQIAIAKILSDIDSEIAVLNKQLNKTRAIKQGMMQELLTGKTRLV